MTSYWDTIFWQWRTATVSGSSMLQILVLTARILCGTLCLKKWQYNMHLLFVLVLMINRPATGVDKENSRFIRTKDKQNFITITWWVMVHSYHPVKLPILQHYYPIISTMSNRIKFNCRCNLSQIKLLGNWKTLISSWSHWSCFFSPAMASWLWSN